MIQYNIQYLIIYIYILFIYYEFIIQFLSHWAWMELLAAADSKKTLKSTLDCKYFVYFPPKFPTKPLDWRRK